MSELDLFGLPGIFQSINDSEQSGTLKVQKDDKEAQIVFVKGVIKMAMFSYRPRTLLVEALMHCHDLEKETIESLFVKQRNSKKSLLTFLKEGELPDERLKDERFVAQIYGNQLSEELYELFYWPDVHCEFSQGLVLQNVPDKDLLNFPIAINPQSICMEAMKRQDDWARIRKVLPSNRDIPFLIQHPSNLNQNPDPELKSKIFATLSQWSEFAITLEKMGYTVDNAIKVLTTLAKNGVIQADNLKHCKKLLKVIEYADKNKNLGNLQAKLRLPYEHILHILHLLAEQDKITIEVTSEINKIFTILTLVNGVRDFDEILEQSRMPSFTLANICSTLVTAKFFQLKNPDELLQLAELDILREDTKKCIRIYERVEELGRKTFNTVKWLASAYESIGLTGKAVEKYRELGNWAMDGNIYAEAVRAYRKVVEFTSEDNIQLETYEKLITAYNKWGKKEEAAEISAKYARKVSVFDKRKAIIVLDTANRNYPSSPSNLELMATLYLELGDKENAIQTYSILANLFKKQEDADKSLESYARILAIDPSNVKAHLELAHGYMEFGKIQEGVKQYKELGNILNNTIQTAFKNNQMYNIGTIPEILIDVCEAILTYDPNDITAREWLADTYIATNNEKNALNILRELLGFLQKDELSEQLVVALRKVIRLDVDDFRSRKLLADTLLRQKKLKAAINEYMELGVRCEKTDLRRAGEAFDAIIGIDPFNLTARQKRSEILFARNLHAKAVDEYKLVGYLAKAIGLIPEAIQAFSQIAMLSGDKEIWCFQEVGLLCETLHENQKAIEYHKNYALKSLAHANYGEVYQAATRILIISPNEPDGLRLKHLAEQKLAMLEKYLSEIK